ncbi:MAG: hypothetical protein Salg2KO_03550 [Salibacteraceae bacterium]
MQSEYRHIVIEGNIGAGKTTLAKELSAELDAKLILERFENNPFLASFYADRERYALQVELFFLADRYHQLSKNVLGDIFQDYTVYDYHFAKSAIFSTINLTKDEHSLFQSLYGIMERFTPQPDIVVYVHHGIDKLQQQIQARNRSYEEQIPSDYLEKVHHHYLQYFKEVKGFPIVVLDFEQVKNANEKYVLKAIKDVLSTKWVNGLSILNH